MQLLKYPPRREVKESFTRARRWVGSRALTRGLDRTTRRHRFRSTLPWARKLALFGLATASAASLTTAADQPQWGQAWSRNMVSAEKHLPQSFDPKSGANVRWIAKLGTESHSTAIIAHGRVYVGTNNGEPRDPKHEGDRGVLMCLDERDGHLLWQLVVPKRDEDIFMDWPKTGISSSVTVEGDRVYLVSNRGEVMCLDARGLANGNDGPFRDEGEHMTPRGTNAPAAALRPGALDADILWVVDLKSEVGIWPHDAAHSSILIHGNFLYVNTGTGVDNTHKRIRAPDAPSLVVLDKRSGKVVARDNEKIGPNIFHCTWSSPSLGRLHGQECIFFAGGDGVVYAFAPWTGKSADSSDAQPRLGGLKKIWQFDFDPTGPKENVHAYNNNRREGPSNIYGMPVFSDDRLYVAGGGDWFWGKNEAWLKCLDLQNVDRPPSAGHTVLRWSSSLGRHTMATPAVLNGLVYVTDSMRMVHCLEADSGQPIWTHELNGEIWASTLVADGKVFVGSRRGDFWIFGGGREKRVLSTVELGAPISATATAANGTIYIVTMTHLYAIQEGAHAADTR